jgi:outer membrane lipoprotein-sorting protein
MNHSEFEKKIRMMELLDAKNTVLYRVYLSAEERVPIRWDSYKADGGKTQTWFKNLKINAGLSDDLFKL